jgi:hypothetical protein
MQRRLPAEAQKAISNQFKLRVSVEVHPEGGVSKRKIEETKAALRELGLPDDLNQS